MLSRKLMMLICALTLVSACGGASQPVPTEDPTSPEMGAAISASQAVIDQTVMVGSWPGSTPQSSPSILGSRRL